MALTLSEELALVETAISDVLTKGQSIQIGDRSYSRADLKTLRDWRMDVINRISKSGTMARTVAEF
ncbi:MAG: hypothetical protein ABII09_03640 [Planctomycetota bacterium]